MLSPEASSALDPARLAHQARTFFDVELRFDAATSEIELGPAGAPTGRVRVASTPLDDAILERARRGVEAIGGAGFDALVDRARSVLRVSAIDGDVRAPLLVAAIVASIVLGPIVPPDEVTIFGVRGARERLERPR